MTTALQTDRSGLSGTIDDSAKRAFIPEIDALRAVAIGLVVAYHATPLAVPSGLVGVDVFFVVSGFLILGGIWRDLATQRFSLLDFFKRRVLRIVPPLTIVLVATSIATSWVLVTPQEVADFRRDLVVSLTFTANNTYADVLGYFDSVASRHVLLHLWSLSVEEQFYLVAPFALTGLFPLRRRLGPTVWRSLAIIAGTVLGLASLAAALVVAQGTEPPKAFYLLQYRLWEFLVGGLCYALRPGIVRLGERVRDAGLVLGLLLIVVPAIVVTPGVGFPGLNVLPSVLGTAMVIGCSGGRAGVAARLVTTAPQLWLGALSYELYLWHWPVFSLARFANFGRLDGITTAVCVCVAVGLAYLTYRGPSRWLQGLRRGRAFRRDMTTIVATVSLFAVCGMGALAATATVQSAMSAAIPPPLVPEKQHASGCRLTDPGPVAAKCSAGTALGPLGLVIGDSHAGANFPVLSQFAREHGAGLLVASFAGCSPFLTVNRHSDYSPAACRAIHEQTLRALRLRRVPLSFAIITAQWFFHRWDVDGADKAAAFKTGLDETIDALRASGATRILIIGTPPLLRREPSDCVLRAMRSGADANSLCAVPASDHRKKAAEVDGVVNQVAAERGEIRVVDPTDSFCDGDWCSPLKDGAMLFTDHDHLSAAGTARMIEAARMDFLWVIGAGQQGAGG